MNNAGNCPITLGTIFACQNYRGVSFLTQQCIEEEDAELINIMVWLCLCACYETTDGNYISYPVTLPPDDRIPDVINEEPLITILSSQRIPPPLITGLCIRLKNLIAEPSGITKKSVRRIDTEKSKSNKKLKPFVLFKEFIRVIITRKIEDHVVFLVSDGLERKNSEIDAPTKRIQVIDNITVGTSRSRRAKQKRDSQNIELSMSSPEGIGVSKQNQNLIRGVGDDQRLVWRILKVFSGLSKCKHPFVRMVSCMLLCTASSCLTEVQEQVGDKIDEVEGLRYAFGELQILHSAFSESILSRSSDVSPIVRSIVASAGVSHFTHLSDPSPLVRSIAIQCQPDFHQSLVHRCYDTDIVARKCAISALYRIFPLIAERSLNESRSLENNKKKKRGKKLLEKLPSLEENSTMTCNSTHRDIPNQMVDPIDICHRIGRMCFSHQPSIASSAVKFVNSFILGHPGLLDPSSHTEEAFPQYAVLSMVDILSNQIGDISIQKLTPSLITIYAKNFMDLTRSDANDMNPLLNLGVYIHILQSTKEFCVQHLQSLSNDEIRTDGTSYKRCLLNRHIVLLFFHSAIKYHKYIKSKSKAPSDINIRGYHVPSYEDLLNIPHTREERRILLSAIYELLLLTPIISEPIITPTSIDVLAIQNNHGDEVSNPEKGKEGNIHFVKQCKDMDVLFHYVLSIINKNIESLKEAYDISCSANSHPMGKLRHKATTRNDILPGKAAASNGKKKRKRLESDGSSKKIPQNGRRTNQINNSDSDKNSNQINNADYDRNRMDVDGSSIQHKEFTELIDFNAVHICSNILVNLLETNINLSQLANIQSVTSTIAGISSLLQDGTLNTENTRLFCSMCPIIFYKEINVTPMRDAFVSYIRAMRLQVVDTDDTSVETITRVDSVTVPTLSPPLTLISLTVACVIIILHGCEMSNSFLTTPLNESGEDRNNISANGTEESKLSNLLTGHSGQILAEISSCVFSFSVATFPCLPLPFDIGLLGCSIYKVSECQRKHKLTPSPSESDSARIIVGTEAQTETNIDIPTFQETEIFLSLLLVTWVFDLLGYRHISHNQRSDDAANVEGSNHHDNKIHSYPFFGYHEVLRSYVQTSFPLFLNQNAHNSQKKDNKRNARNKENFMSTLDACLSVICQEDYPVDFGNLGCHGIGTSSDFSDKTEKLIDISIGITLRRALDFE